MNLRNHSGNMIQRAQSVAIRRTEPARTRPGRLEVRKRLQDDGEGDYDEQDSEKNPEERSPGPSTRTKTFGCGVESSRLPHCEQTSAKPRTHMSAGNRVLTS